ncbi:hypothetical protein GYH73_009935 [Bacillus megaterium]|nr:hypothetical protein [Priestia megaterium]
MTFILSFVPIVVPFGILISLIAFTAAFLQSKSIIKSSSLQKLELLFKNVYSV